MNRFHRIANTVIKLIEAAVIFFCIVCCFFIDEYPTYHAATISMESWPKYFLGGLVIMSFIGTFQYKMNSNYRIHMRYDHNAMAFAAGACAIAFGKALIDDVGDALVIYEDIHTSPTISGWTSLFIMVIVVCLYGVWIFHKANITSRQAHKKLHTIAIIECASKED